MKGTEILYKKLKENGIIHTELFLRKLGPQTIFKSRQLNQLNFVFVKPKFKKIKKVKKVILEGRALEMSAND